ncbi:MAG: DeoR/GlpR family DNA-binding transcription regulator [Paracoccaceae bacterium]
MSDPIETPRLKKAARREQILLELRLKPHLRVSDLAARFGVTTETVRRDVEELSRAGHLRRAHGGVSAPHPGEHGDLDERRHQRIAERKHLGRFAASLVEDGDTIMIDAGSTTLEFARFLAFSGKRVVAITNSLQVAMTLGQSSEARVRLAPGAYLPAEAAVIGTETVEFLSRYNADACFIGAAGLSEVGVTEAVEGFESVKRVMLGQSRAKRLLIDSSKFGRTYFASVARLQEIGTLITDREPEGEIARQLGDGRVEILVPPEDAG